MGNRFGERCLEGRVAIVTGGASGIGETIAGSYAELGATVVIADVADSPRSTASGAGERVRVIRTDVTSEEDVRRLMETVAQDYGRLDVLCNNAGIDGPPTLTADCTADAFLSVMAVNVLGPFLCMRHAIPLMLRGGGGSIVNVASIAALVATPNFAAYSASKGALLALTRTAAVEYATSGIRANALCPGLVETPLAAQLFEQHPEMRDEMVGKQPIGRLATPEEIADAACFLASDASSFVVGSALCVDGGWTAA